MAVCPQRNAGDRHLLLICLPSFSSWSFGSFPTSFFFLLLDNVVTQSFYYSQGFDDVALTPGEAAMVIHNYEVWTGHVVSMEELESGYLKGRLKREDYDLKQRVNLLFDHPFLRDNSRGPSLSGLTCVAAPRGLPFPYLSTKNFVSFSPRN